MQYRETQGARQGRGEQSNKEPGGVAADHGKWSTPRAATLKMSAQWGVRIGVEQCLLRLLSTFPPFNWVQLLMLSCTCYIIEYTVLGADNFNS